MKVNIELIPADLRAIATKMANVTTTIKTALSSNLAVDVAALFPGGTQLDAECITACNEALIGCNALIKVADNAGLNARLQRLGSDMTKLAHANAKHTISYYIVCFETLFADLFGNSNA